MRGKLIAIVAILWVAAVVAISVAFYANQSSNASPELISTCLQHADWNYCTSKDYGQTVDWGGWSAWTGTVTLVTIVAIAITAVVFRRKEA